MGLKQFNLHCLTFSVIADLEACLSFLCGKSTSFFLYIFSYISNLPHWNFFSSDIVANYSIRKNLELVLRNLHTWNTKGIFAMQMKEINIH